MSYFDKLRERLKEGIPEIPDTLLTDEYLLRIFTNNEMYTLFNEFVDSLFRIRDLEENMLALEEELHIEQELRENLEMEKKKKEESKPKKVKLDGSKEIKIILINRGSSDSSDSEEN